MQAITRRTFFASFATLSVLNPRGKLMNRTAHKSLVVTSALVVAFAAGLLGARAQNPAQATASTGGGQNGAAAGTTAQTGTAGGGVPPPQTTARRFRKNQ